MKSSLTAIKFLSIAFLLTILLNSLSVLAYDFTSCSSTFYDIKNKNFNKGSETKIKLIKALNNCFSSDNKDLIPARLINTPTLNNLMIKTVIILPENYNNGQPIDEAIYKEIENAFLLLAGGFTLEHSTGKWIDASGKVFEDKNRNYIISIEPSKLNKLKEYISYIRVLLDPESIYFETSEVMIDFIK